MSSYRPGDFDVETASGLYLNLADPRPEQVTLGDVAAGLANTCRYGGQTRLPKSPFYSVAEHARIVSRRLALVGASVAVQLAGLHHDDAEAYVGDYPRPMKCLVPGLKDVEARVFAVVVEALGIRSLPWDDPAIKEADDWALSMEAYHLMSSRGRGWWCEGLYDPAATEPSPGMFLSVVPSTARGEFLDEHESLVRELMREAAA